MRARFFWIILCILSVVVIATVLLHGEFLRRERLDLIDQQVRETAAALLDSQIGELRQIDFEHVEAIISEELGENRIGKFFVIRNDAGQILFESAGAKLLPIPEIPRSPRWITLIVKGQYVRILNLALPRINDRTLQVGIVIDEDLVTPGLFTRANLLFVTGIMVLGLLFAWILTSLLMKPVSHLAAYVDQAATTPEQRMELPALPPGLRAMAVDSNSKDELTRLLVGFDTLIDRVNRDYQISRFWSYQMAHELKTPMALIEMHVADARRAGQMPEKSAQAIINEIFGVSETITSFLSWAELENSSGQKHLHVIRASNLVTEIQKRLETGYAGRLHIRVREDFELMTNIQHAEQAVSNLILNALNYSPGDQPVFIDVFDGEISVKDHGPGIPPVVLKRAGEPFNRGESQSPQARKGTGLGLALVYSIARQYGWKVDLESTASGTVARLTVPEIHS